MLSHLHTGLTEMFRARPELAAEVLTGMLGMTLPDHRQTRVGPAEVELRPTELHADAVIHLEDHHGHTVAAVIVEVQLRPDDEKRWTWPVYLTSVRRRSRAPTLLLVVCPDPATARWAATPLDLGHGLLLRPAVLGPGLVPPLTDPDAATHTPELAVLAVLAHASDLTPRVRAVLESLVAALATLPEERALDYASLVLDVVPETVRAHLEELMSAQPHIEDSYLARRFRAQGEAHGRAEGEAHGRAEGEARGEAHGRAAILLRILDHRGIAVPAQARATITECTDLGRLETWSDHALTATSIDDVLGRP